MHRSALILLFVSGPALAHPSGVSGFIHPFAGLDHLLAMLAVGLWASQIGGRWRWAVPATFVTSMAAGFAVNSGLPFVEPMIAASVLVLGLMIALQVKWRAAGAVLAAVFALFHGMAHAAEMPLQGSPLVYAAGFMLATALLHAAGVGLGSVPRSRFAGIPVALAGAWLLASAAL